MKINAWKNKNSGMTLVELLVAMVVGLILLGGVYVSFVSSTTTNSMNEQLSRMQENGRFAMEIITRTVRSVGYQGCGGLGVTIDNVIREKDYAFRFSEAVFGYDAVGTGWSPLLPNEPQSVINNSPMPGSDILVLRTQTDDDVFLQKVPAATAANFHLPPDQPDYLKPDDIVMVADCTSTTAKVFHVTDVNYGAGGNNVVVLHTTATSEYPGNNAHTFDFDDTAELIKMNTVTFFVRNVDSAGNSTEPTLYRRVGVADPEPLVEGIENMQIRYGEDTSGNRAADVYRTANQVASWDNVVSVRIGLLLRSPSELLRGETDGQPYIVNGSTFVAPGDRRLRTVMSTTVGIRNRLR